MFLLFSPHTQDMPIAQILHCIAQASIWSVTGGFDVSYSVNVVGQYFYIRSSICHINLGHLYVCTLFFFFLFFSSMSKIICSPCNCHTCLFILSQKTITGKLTCCMLQEVNNRLVSLFGDVFVKMDRPFCDTDTS